MSDKFSISIKKMYNRTERVFKYCPDIFSTTCEEFIAEVWNHMKTFSLHLNKYATKDKYYLNLKLCSKALVF